MLRPCPNCKERAVTTKVYRGTDPGVKVRVEFCINKGCGYKQDLPNLKEKSNA